MTGRKGEKCEHVNVREGGRCACRGWSLASGSSLCLPFSPALSSRGFPPIHSLQLGRHICSHFITFAFSSLPTDCVDRCSCSHLYGLSSLPQQCNRGCLQTPACSRSPLWERFGGWGGFLNESLDWRLVPQHLLRRGNEQKVGGLGERGGRQRGSDWTRGGEAPTGRRMVMPAPRAPVVLLLYRLRVIQAQPCFSST